MYTWLLTRKNALISAVVPWVVYTWNLQLTRKNALISAVVPWVVYTRNLQLTRKNALIIPVVSWVVCTWNLQLTRKNALINLFQRLLFFNIHWIHGQLTAFFQSILFF